MIRLHPDLRQRQFTGSRNQSHISQIGQTNACQQQTSLKAAFGRYSKIENIRIVCCMSRDSQGLSPVASNLQQGRST